jgi:hypothetical protein
MPELFLRRKRRFLQQLLKARVPVEPDVAGAVDHAHHAAPRTDRISYGPRRVPDASVMGGKRLNDSGAAANRRVWMGGAAWPACLARNNPRRRAVRFYWANLSFLMSATKRGSDRRGSNIRSLFSHPIHCESEAYARSR